MNVKKIWILYLALLMGVFNLTAEETLNKEENAKATINFSLTPPSGWETISDSNQLPAKVRAIYIGNGKRGFTPSINLATEETVLPLSQYVTLAKRYHESHPDTRCYLLGLVDTKSGKAELLQIDRKTQFGSVRFLQGIMIVDKIAYVLTATCLEEEFPQLSLNFLQSIKSFTLLPTNPGGNP